MELRHRGNRSDVSHRMETFQIDENVDNAKEDDLAGGEWTKNGKCLSAVPSLLVALTALFTLNVFVYYMDNRLPAGVDETNSSAGSHHHGFVAARAMSTLVRLANLGSRPVGSRANEVLAFDLIKTEIKNIANDSGNVYDVEMSNQMVSGSFLLNMHGWKYMLSYEGLQNVVAKLDPKRGTADGDAVLLNCHYDTVPAGPGVSDDGVNCAVMTELLRVLAKSPGLLRPVIFLFNGGEETILQASHGFVTRHPWRKHGKYVVNLDSCGAGGREILFQTTKTDAYLVDLYARTVPHPYAQAVAEELFQSGVIPSDTDFRIFRDFGNMSGLDLAHYKNGYVYHTEYDDLNRVGPPVLQNTGDNLYGLVKAMSAANHNGTKTPLPGARPSGSKYVYFDVLGVYMFSYTEPSATVANLLIVLVSLFSVFLSLGRVTAGMNRRQYAVHLLTVAASPVCAFVLTVLSCVLLAHCLDRSGNAMSWYGHPVNLTVYPATAALAALSATVFHPKVLRWRRPPSAAGTVGPVEWTVSLLNGVQLFWTVLLFAATVAGVRSGYVLAVMVLFPAAVSCALGVLDAYRTAPGLWITAYAASLLAPATFVFYLTQMFAGLYVPLAGRLGPDINPDYPAAALMAASTYATVGHLCPIAALVKNPRVLLAAAAGWTLLSVTAVLGTPLGFPYAAPAYQRIDLVHTSRAFYGFDRTVRRNDSGVLVVNWDRRGAQVAAQHVPRMADAVPTDCAGELLCGVPLTGKLASRSGWLAAAQPPVLLSPASTAHRAVVVAPESGRPRRRLEFDVTGPERIAVYVSPYPGTTLKSWSFSGQPEPTTRWQSHDVYVIRHSRGTGDPTWHFWLEQESERGFDEATINVTVTYTWVVREQLVFDLDDEFEVLVNSFPPWVHVNYAAASVEAFVY